MQTREYTVTTILVGKAVCVCAYEEAHTEKEAEGFQVCDSLHEGRKGDVSSQIFEVPLPKL